MVFDPSSARRVATTEVLPAPRFRYSPVVVAHPFAFVSGLVGLDPATGALATGGAYGQTVQILANFTALLQEQGWSLSQLVVARLFCTSSEGAAKMNRAWEELFKDDVPPARTSVIVAGLPLGAEVEIEFQLVLTQGA